ncbi:hypothetical protein DVH24_016684 [Malus domestica]|uniref:Uncharacterized protein n=1 Tax=Malus domestica TaxID=3750 RepID=A0A498HV34_MALDO|nr:hypothetical protein DVH24_016684 [Malus domestica]
MHSNPFDLHRATSLCCNNRLVILFWIYVVDESAGFISVGKGGVILHNQVHKEENWAYSKAPFRFQNDAAENAPFCFCLSVYWVLVSSVVFRSYVVKVILVATIALQSAQITRTTVSTATSTCSRYPHRLLPVGSVTPLLQAHTGKKEIWFVWLVSGSLWNLHWQSCNGIGIGIGISTGIWSLASTSTLANSCLCSAMSLTGGVGKLGFLVGQEY